MFCFCLKSFIGLNLEVKYVSQGHLILRNCNHFCLSLRPGYRMFYILNFMISLLLPPKLIFSCLLLYSILVLDFEIIAMFWMISLYHYIDFFKDSTNLISIYLWYLFLLFSRFSLELRIKYSFVNIYQYLAQFWFKSCLIISKRHICISIQAAICLSTSKQVSFYWISICYLSTVFDF